MQKRDSGSATLACSDGGNSSLTKSFTAPSARLEDGINILSEERTWNSMLDENVPADFLSVDLGIPSDSSPVEEIPSVQSVSTFSLPLRQKKRIAVLNTKRKGRRKTEGEL